MTTRVVMRLCLPVPLVSRSVLTLLLLGALGSASTSCAGLAWRRNGPTAIAAAQALVEQAETTAIGVARARAAALAVQGTRQTLGDAWTQAGADPQALGRQAALTADAANRPQAVDALLAAGVTFDPADPIQQPAQTRAWIRQGAFPEARALAWSALGTLPPDDAARAAWTALWYDAHQADPTFFAPTAHTLEPGVDLDRLEVLGGGSTITLKIKLAGVTIGAFKPWQTRYQSNYRAELAAYRLCALMHCGFQIPINREVRISEADFLRLYGIRSLNQATGYSAGFADLIWFADEDGTRWLHGTWKEWVPGFTGFPIEFTQYWSPLVARGMTRERLDEMTIQQAIAPFRGESGNYGGISSRLDALTPVDFARQLSNLHVFDALINNWDRYSGIFWGANCQFNNGRFVSIDNGAAFQSRLTGNHSDTATFQRLQNVQIFSRQTIAAIRWMDLDRTRALLLPPSANHPEEDQAWERFVARRERLLAYVDGLIESRGEDAVLVLP